LSSFHSFADSKPLRFAFVANNRNPSLFRQDASFVYRCENVAEALAAAGHQVALLHLRSFPLRARFDAVVFHRPRYSLRLRLALRAARRAAGAAVFADFDDLVFDDAYAEFSPAARNALLPPATVKEQLRSHRRALEMFDRVIVSTEPLLAHVRERVPTAKVAVLHNAVFRKWREGSAESVSNPSRKIITYLPGTRSHDRDFAAVADALVAVLARHPDTGLHITGPLAFDLAVRPEQVVRSAKVPFDQFHHRVREGWVNIAPLEMTPFTRCKSALKVMEAGFWGVPTVCSPIPDAIRFVDAGAMLADTSQAWQEQLEAMLDPERRRQAVMGLRERVLARADVDAVARQLVDLVRAARDGAG